MNPASLDLTIYRDRDFSKTLYFKTQGEAMDLTGYTGKAEIRIGQDTDALIVAFHVDITPLIGSIVLSLTDTQTILLKDDTAYWDLVLTDPHGLRQSFVEGMVIVKGTVTRDSGAVGGMEVG
jgi:hypothetical protein